MMKSKIIEERNIYHSKFEISLAENSSTFSEMKILSLSLSHSFLFVCLFIKKEKRRKYTKKMAANKIILNEAEKIIYYYLSFFFVSFRFVFFLISINEKK